MLARGMHITWRVQVPPRFNANRAPDMPNSPTATDTDTLLEFAHGCALAAGEVIPPHFPARIDIEHKHPHGSYDPVTIADRAAESVIEARIAQFHPTHG